MISSAKNSIISTQPINIFEGLASLSDDPSLLKSSFDNFDFSPLITNTKHLGLLVLTDQSGSSEETGFETDTMDELSSPSAADKRSLSSESTDEKSSQNNVQVFCFNINHFFLNNLLI